MTDRYIIAHDMGTSGNKAVLVSIEGEIVDCIKESYPLYHPKPGYAEQDPLEWWEAVAKTTRDVLQNNSLKPEKIVGLTFSSQVQSLIPVDTTGKPLTPAMTWLDVRSADILHKNLACYQELLLLMAPVI